MECVEVTVLQGLTSVCDQQIVIRQSDSRDGSGWPSDDEDLELGDVLLSERTSSGHRSTILV